MAQSSFLDLIKQSPKGSMLDDILSIVDWKPFERRLKRIFLSHGMGRPAYAPLSMFKILILQHLYDLSDPEMEHQLYDRLSFRKFCGFSMGDALPDETTICRFRLGLLGKSEVLFHLFLEQIEAKGLLVRKGTLVDATVIPSSGKRPSARAQSESDPEAGWTKKQGQYTYGYKAHVGVDQGSGIVMKQKITSASFHDSQVLHHVVTGKEEAVYADKAYDSKKIRQTLTSAGIKPRIIRRRPKGGALSWAQTKLNTLYGKVRCHVERVFAHLKSQHGYWRARYRGWDKNQLHLDLLTIAYNMKRTVSLLKKRLPQEQYA